LLLILQLSTLLILLLAANTAYADFPRLANFLAQDGYLPRQLTSLGDRLVFSNGILALSGFAGVLLLVFGGSVTRLIPLYAVGVFLSFTLSQAGMVVHWWKDKTRGWHGSGDGRVALQQIQPGGLAGGVGRAAAGVSVPHDPRPLPQCVQAAAPGYG
jgi:amino acid transporter